MSADLFAAFGNSAQASAPRQNQATPVPPDPFSFLAFDSAAPQQAQSSQQSAQWPLSHQPTTGQPDPWFTAASGQRNEPQKSDAWGAAGGLGDLASFQGGSTSFDIPPKSVQTEEDDEGWGEFEVAFPSPAPQPPAPSTTAERPRSRVIRASTIDMLSNKLVNLAVETSTPEPWQQRPSWEKDPKPQQPPQSARNPDANVLFDADFEAQNGDGEDEFGNFETGTSALAAPQAAPSKTAVDLLSLDSPRPPPKKQPPGLVLSNAAFQANPTSYPEAPKSPYGSFQHRKPESVKQLQVKPPAAAKGLRDAKEASASPITAWPSVEHDDFGNEWEEFEGLPDATTHALAKQTPKSKPKSAPAPSPAPASDWEWQDWGGTENQLASANTDTNSQPPTASPTIEDKPGPPPTNIPPPAILLSLFPELLDLASASLLKPLLTLSPSSPSYQRVLSSPATLTFLRGYLALATVAARLIAGRKHRWHRDKFLARGMSISAAVPTAAGGQRGMKLASVDRSQAAREDREAAEVVACWKAQVGRLRAVLAGVNAAHDEEAGAGCPLLRVPEIGLGLVVNTAKGVPTAPRACVVCGLRRDERVAKVDAEVEDSFGEWWVEFWGHRECRNFWVRHERELRQR